MGITVTDCLPCLNNVTSKPSRVAALLDSVDLTNHETVSFSLKKLGAKNSTVCKLYVLIEQMKIFLQYGIYWLAKILTSHLLLFLLLFFDFTTDFNVFYLD